MPESCDIHWLAGLLEGEGCFTRSHHTSPAIQLQMTDRDVVERAARLFGNQASVKRRSNPGRPHEKTVWSVTLYGHRAVEWMRRLQPHMGARRSSRIAELLAEWDAVEHKNPKGAGSSRAKCHPEKPVFGGGLCQTCYMRLYRTGWRVRAPKVAA